MLRAVSSHIGGRRDVLSMHFGRQRRHMDGSPTSHTFEEIPMTKKKQALNEPILELARQLAR